eukprot:11221270-Lingulodinium_polyedra.AAC.1
MQNRVLQFVFAQALAPGTLREVVPCAPCMAAWISAGAAAHDAAGALRPPLLPVRDAAAQGVDGFDALAVAARVP